MLYSRSVSQLGKEFADHTQVGIDVGFTVSEGYLRASGNDRIPDTAVGHVDAVAINKVDINRQVGRGNGTREFWRQAKMMHHMDTWLWLVQVVTAIVILVMASAHVINILSNLPISADKSAAAIQGGMVPFYLVLFAALDLHIAIGLYRVGVKFGILNRENRLKWRKYALYLVIGLALLSLATHYSFATMAI